MKNRFYVCSHCGNLIGMIRNVGVPMMCCGQKMTEIVPNTVEASVEKHLPVVTVDGNKLTVTIGSTIHPMTEEHHIAWVYVETDKGGHRRLFNAGDNPSFTLTLEDEKAISVSAYCNLHGLWKTDL